MKKFLALFVAAVAAAAFAEIAAVRLSGGGNAASAGRAVALRATSAATNGTVAVKRVTQYTARWTESETVTNATYTFDYEPYRVFVSNVVVVTGGRVKAGVYVTNYVTNAVYETAYRVTTNTVLDVETLLKPRTRTLAWTNAVWSATLSGGVAETNLTDVAIFPDDVLDVSGTAFDDGKGEAVLLIER